jgi:Tetratricopeptide repeat
MARTSALVAVFAILLCAVVRADVLVTSDGIRLSGDIKKTPDGYRITDSDGKTTNVAADKVKSIQLGGQENANVASSAMAGLASLRRSVEYSDNLPQIIDRYQRFIAATKDATTVTEAQKDLAQWQDRQTRGLSKVGSRWVTPTEKQGMADQAGALVDQAYAVMSQGRMRDADPLLTQALEADPQNVAAMYLRGVTQYRNDQLAPARKSFEAVNAVIADHAPTLNNLAIILFRQKQAIPACNFLDQAIVAAPVNKVMLDNTAEVLNSLTDEQRKNPVAAKLNRHFAEQEGPMQEIMSRQGMHRWGATWVDDATLERVRAAEKEVKEKITQMQADFDSAKSRYDRIDIDINAQRNYIATIESQTYYRNPDGTLVRIPFPPAYYDAVRQEQQLEAEKVQLANKLDTMRAAARQVQQDVPQPKFTGIQNLIGIEGAPMKIPQPATMPATQPNN